MEDGEIPRPWWGWESGRRVERSNQLDSELAESGDKVQGDRGRRVVRSIRGDPLSVELAVASTGALI